MDILAPKKENRRKSVTSKFKLFLKKEEIIRNSDFFKNRLVFWLLASSLFFNIVNWAALAIFIKPVDKTIILHYNVYFGVDSIGHWGQVYFLPTLGLVILLVNLLLAKYFYLQKERIAGHIMMMTALMAQLSLLIAAVSIILINY
jgi:hypothetical protein